MAQFMSLLFILKSERDSSVNTRSVFMSWLGSLEQCSAKTGTMGGVPLLFWGNECLGTHTKSWSRKWSLEVFLPSPVQNSFQPDQFLLPAPRASSVLETQRWTHLQQDQGRFLCEIGYLHQKLGTISLISAGTHPKCQFFWYLVVRYRECCLWFNRFFFLIKETIP